MVLQSSNASDERLEVSADGGPPEAMRIPLDEISFSTRSVCDKDQSMEDDDSLVSELSRDEEEQDSPETKVVDAVPPRSIFSSYWKDGAASTSKKRSAAPPTKRVQRPQQQQQDIPDPFQFFGIERPEQSQSQVESNDSFSSLNTYERILMQHETSSSSSKSSLTRNSRPFWMSFLGGEGGHHCSEPHLVGRIHQHHPTRNVHSDSRLVCKPKKSCLRRGRFGSASDKEKSSKDQRPSSSNTSTRVCFQAKIEVCVFDPPVQHFASNGWSKWFG